MRLRWTCAAVVVAALGGFLAAKGFSEEDEAEDPMAAGMAEMMRLAQPGENHAWMDFQEGTWTGAGKAWKEPGGAPKDISARTTFRWELGNRFMRQDYEAEFEGEPFLGLGITGYDNKAQEYQWVWMDTMGTVMMYGTGSRKGDVMTTRGTWDSPWGEMAMRFVTRKASNDEFHLEMWQAMGGQEEHKAMEMRFTRTK